MLSRERIESVLSGDIIGKEIIVLESATSTNDVAMEMGLKKETPEGLVIIADAQSSGRGRMGRTWISPPAVNLYFTVLLKPPLPAREAPLLTLATAVAAVSAIREYTGLNAEIKWPNDVLIKGKKAGGILLEMKTGNDNIKLLALGIGINVNMSLDVLPLNIRRLSTSLKIAKGKSVNRLNLLGKVLAELEHTYKILLNGNKRALINEWLSLNCTIGNKVSVRNHDGVISGIADGVNDNGELLVRLSSGAIETVSAGDVTILKDEKQ